MTLNQNYKNSSFLFYFIFITIICFFAWHFKDLILGTHYLLSNDINYSSMYVNKMHLPQSLFGGWSSGALLGYSYNSFLTIDNILLWAMGTSFMMTWGFLLPIVIVFFASFMYFRSLSFHSIASLLGAFLTAFSPAFLTYLRVGHLGKMYLIAIVFMVFYFLDRIIKSDKINVVVFLLLAFFIALGFLMGATQTALYFCFFLPFYFLYFVVKNLKQYIQKDIQKETLKRVFKKGLFFGLAVILSIAMASPVFLKQLSGSIKDSSAEIESAPLSAAEQKQKKAENWNWATQWSNHPLEITELFAPGTWGLLSGDASNPYWGKLGQTAGYENHKQGFRNFSLSSHYLGIVIFLFAFYALFFVNNRAKWFWAMMALICLLLNFGRYLPPFFALLYQLPYMDNMRNPNKFFLVFYFAMVILAVYGLNHFIRVVLFARNFRDLSSLHFEESRKTLFNFFNIVILATMAGLYLGSYFYRGSLEQFLQQFNYSSREQIVILENIRFYLLRGIAFYLLILLPIYLLFYYKKAKEIFKPLSRWSTRTISIGITVYLLFLGFVDVFWINRFFISPQQIPNTFPAPDPVAEFLESKREKAQPYRLKFLGYSGYHHNFIYNQVQPRNISLYDPLALRTGLPDDLKLLFQNTQSLMGQPLMAYNCLAINYFLSASPLPPEMKMILEGQMPIGNQFIYLYRNPSATPMVYFTDKTVLKTNTVEIASFWKQTNLNLLAASMVHQAEHLLEDNFARNDLIQEDPLKVETNKIETNLSDVSASTAIVTPETNSPIQPTLSASENKIKILSWESHKIKFQFKNNRASTLVLANQYNPQWILETDNKSIAPFLVNHLLNGYNLPPTGDTSQQATLIFASEEKNDFYFALSFYVAMLLLLGIYGGQIFITKYKEEVAATSATSTDSANSDADSSPETLNSAATDSSEKERKS